MFGLAGFWAVALAASSAPAAEKAPDFNRDIRPILSRTCFACHGPDEHVRRGGMRLDDRDAAMSVNWIARMRSAGRTREVI